MTSPYLPCEAEIMERVQESPSIFTLRLRITDVQAHAAYRFVPGQFNMLSLFGVGEVPISIVSDPQDEQLFDHTVRALGRVTNGLAALKTGDRAPEFTLYDTDKKARSLKEFAGKKTVLAFYPGAFTGVCTKEMCSLRDALSVLGTLNAQVVGISVDSIFANKAFAEQNKLGFPLLSDPDHAVAQAWGVWGEKSMYGKKYRGIIRSSFLVDGKGKLTRVWYNVKPEETVPEAQQALAGKV